MKTPAEQNKEIAALEACKKFVPQYNFFGEDNWEMIDAEIYTIEYELTEQQCADRYLLRTEKMDLLNRIGLSKSNPRLAELPSGFMERGKPHRVGGGPLN